MSTPILIRTSSAVELAIQVRHLQSCVSLLVAERDRFEAAIQNYRKLAADDHCTCSHPQETDPLLHRPSCLYRSRAFEAEEYLEQSEGA